MVANEESSASPGPPDDDGSPQVDLGNVALRLTPDGMAILLSCSDPGDHLTELLDRIEKEVEPHKLRAPLKRDEVERQVQDARSEEAADLVDVILAQGLSPRESEDGKVNWTEDFFATGFELDAETDKVDYWSKLENLNVTTNQLLATVAPPKPGTDGTNLLGASVPAREPEEARLNLGENVYEKKKADGSVSVHSGIDGRLRYVDGVVSVDDVYSISGSVSIATGNVDHVGTVFVGGDICAGAVVKATGHIVVQGVIEPSNITAGGNLTVRGGIVGDENSEISVSGELEAKYIHGATVTAGENVTVVNEILRSFIKTRGKLLIRKGRIVGGSVMAGQGIEVAKAGSDGAERAQLIVGVDFELEGSFQEIRKRISSLKEKLAKLSRDRHRAEYDSVEQSIASAEKELGGAKSVSKDLTGSEIVILKNVDPQTLLQVGTALKELTEQDKAPLRARYDDGTVAIIRS